MNKNRSFSKNDFKPDTFDDRKVSGNSYGALVKHQAENNRTLVQDEAENDIIQQSSVNRHKIKINKFIKKQNEAENHEFNEYQKMMKMAEQHQQGNIVMIKPLNTINREHELSLVNKRPTHKSRPSTSTATS